MKKIMDFGCTSIEIYVSKIANAEAVNRESPARHVVGYASRPCVSPAEQSVRRKREINTGLSDESTSLTTMKNYAFICE